eukprot:952539-Rhodomonas_salina.2
MSGTDVAHGATCYAISGTDIAGRGSERRRAIQRLLSKWVFPPGKFSLSQARPALHRISGSVLMSGSTALSGAAGACAGVP